MRPLLAFAAAAMLPGLAGCTKAEPIARTAPVGVLKGQISIWVANNLIATAESERPRITQLDVAVDGAKYLAKPTIRSYDSKLGWSERADIPMPDGAREAKVVAHVKTGGRRYAIAQEWSSAAGEWRVLSEKVTSSQD